jgi:CCR4-NOT transcriptional regulation complex NOT5 subunit
MKMMELSYKTLPQSADYFPSSVVKEKISTKSLFPKYKMINENIFERLDMETLFFIFYFFKVYFYFKLLNLLHKYSFFYCEGFLRAVYGSKGTQKKNLAFSQKVSYLVQTPRGSQSKYNYHKISLIL